MWRAASRLSNGHVALAWGRVVKRQLAVKPVVVVMPPLSPSMQTATITKWLKQEGEDVDCYESLFEVVTGELLKEGLRDPDEEAVNMEVETQDDAVLVRILAPEGSEVEVDSAIAVLAEEREEVAEVAAMSDSEVRARLASGDCKPFMWQAYLKAKEI